jgi:dTDP-4-dehydrorhamnose reductase
MTAGRLLLTGGTGLLGLALRRVFPGIFQWRFDLTDARTCQGAVGALRPEAVINAAAYTQVDRAESDPAAAWALNERGPANLARACRDTGARLVHFSTDYVFDGRSTRPYLESDRPRPLGVYGASKLAGERAVLAVMPRALIVRTSWLFGPGKTNFVAKVLAQARRGERFPVVDDQQGCPTYSLDLAAAVRSLVQGGHTGLFHVTNQGQTTWYHLARVALEAAGLDPGLITPIKIVDLGQAARRPAFSVLDSGKYQRTVGRTLPAWEDAVRAYAIGWR